MAWRAAAPPVLSSSASSTATSLPQVAVSQKKLASDPVSPGVTASRSRAISLQCRNCAPGWFHWQNKTSSPSIRPTSPSRGGRRTKRSLLLGARMRDSFTGLSKAWCKESCSVAEASSESRAHATTLFFFLKGYNLLIYALSFF